MRGGLLRAVATGAVALESGAASREPLDEPAQLRAAARRSASTLAAARVAVNDYYRVFSENGAGPVAVVDGLGSVALAERAKRVVPGPAAVLGAARRRGRRGRREPRRGDAAAARRARRAARASSTPPTRAARRTSSPTAQTALADHDGPAVAVIWR